MKSLFLEPSSNILSEKMARVDLDETTPEFSSLSEEGNIISPSVHGKTYRLELEPDQLFCCSETGIKFQVKSPVTIDYELEYGKDYIKQIKDSGYELVGPLFNITVKPGVVSSVHLPHYLFLEVLVLKRKWKSLKDAYTRYRRQIREFKSGQAAGEPPQYVHAKDLDFLRPILELSSTQSSWHSSATAEDDENEEDVDAAENSQEIPDAPLPDEPMPDTPLLDTPLLDTPLQNMLDNSRSSVSSEVVSPTAASMQRRASRGRQDRYNKIVDLMSDFSTKIDDNPTAMFLKSLEPFVNQVPQSRQIAMRKAIFDSISSFIPTGEDSQNPTYPSSTHAYSNCPPYQPFSYQHAPPTYTPAPPPPLPPPPPPPYADFRNYRSNSHHHAPSTYYQTQHAPNTMPSSTIDSTQPPTGPHSFQNYTMHSTQPSNSLYNTQVSNTTHSLHPPTSRHSSQPTMYPYAQFSTPPTTFSSHPPSTSTQQGINEEIIDPVRPSSPPATFQNL